MTFKQLLTSRRAGHAGTAAALTALVLAFFYLVNLIVLGCANHFGWYIYTAPQYDLTVGDAAAPLFADIDTADGGVKILFCDLEENVKTSRQLDFVYETASGLAEKYPDLIEISYVNLWLEPARVAAYREKEDGSERTISSTDVIIDYQGEYIVAPATSFYTLDSEQYVTAYNGEEVLVANILWVTAEEHPVAYFTANHGEEIPLPLYLALARAGYRIDRIDLASVAAVPEDAGLVLISSPIYDFQKSAIGSAYVSELTKLESYVASGGRLFVSLNPDHVAGLPRLTSFLADHGMAVGEGVVVDDVGALPGSSGYSLITDYGDSGLALSLASAAGADGRRVVLSYAAPLSPVESERAEAEALLFSSSTASLREEGKQTAAAHTPLLLLSDMKEGEGRILLSGSSFLAATDVMSGENYGNKELLYALLSELGAEKVPAGISPVMVDRSAIENLTLGEARLFAVAAVVVVPTLCLAFGLVLCHRRKNH